MRTRPKSSHLPSNALQRVVGMEVVSGLGDGVFWVGLASMLLRRGVGAEGFALAALARLGPRALISAPAGLLADRIDRRKLLIALDLIRGLAMLALAAAAAAGAGTETILLLVAASYTFAAPYRPALTAALPLIAGEGGLASASARVGTVRQLMTFVGPVLGAGLVEFVSPTWAFLFNGATFALSALLLITVREMAGHPGPQLLAENARRGLAAHRAGWIREISAGWTEVRVRPGLLIVTLLVFVMYAARGAELVLHVLVASQRLGMGPSGIGVLTGALGFGALCMLPTAARLAESSHVAPIMMAALASTALPMAGLASLRSPIAASASLVVAGAGVVLFEVVSVVLVQRLARREMLGRVFGVVGMSSNAGKLVGALGAPAVVAAVGLRGALVTSGALVASGGALCLPGVIRLSRATRARRDLLRPRVDVLAALELFDGASRSALEQLADSISTEHVQPGAVLVRQGDPADDLFLIRSGTFTVDDDGVVINAMRPGDWFGEIGLLKRSPRTATVTADSAAELWRIPGGVFLEALAAVAMEPGELLETMTERLARSARVHPGAPPAFA